MDADLKSDSTTKLGTILLGRGLVTKEQLDQALRAQVVGGVRRLGTILVRMKVLTADQLTDALTAQGQRVVTVEGEFNDNVRNKLPRHLCRKYSVLPLSLEGNNVLKLAMADTLDAVAVAEVENYTGHAVQPVLARLSEIEREIPVRVAFSWGDIYKSQLYRSASRVAIPAAVLLLLVGVVWAYRDFHEQRYGVIKLAGDAVIYKNHDLMIDVNKDGSVYFSGRGAFSNGSYGVRFENPRVLATFVAGARRQFSAEQLEWMSWVFREKLKVSEPLLTAASR